MNQTERILFKQLQRHATHYIESSERGIVVDDLDVDSFISETANLIIANGVDKSNAPAIYKVLPTFKIITRTFRILPDGNKFKIQERGFFGFKWHDYNDNPEHYPKRFKSNEKAMKYLAKKVGIFQVYNR